MTKSEKILELMIELKVNVFRVKKTIMTSRIPGTAETLIKK